MQRVSRRRRINRSSLLMADSVQSSSKRVCLSSGNEGQEDIDHISDLPDLVLCHILSLLPTKESVATCILSKRWLCLWTEVSVLSFSFMDFPDNYIRYTDCSKFERCIKDVLSAFQEQTIHRMTLDFGSRSKVDEVRLGSWINVAITRKLQELKLNLWYPFWIFFRLPENVFGCETLVSLDLSGHFLVDVPLNVHLQSLKILRLHGVAANDDSLSRLLTSCPILEDLALSLLKVENVNDAGMGRHKVLINAPLLKRIYLEVVNEYWEYLQVEDCPNLVEATIRVFFPDEHNFFRIFKGLANVKVFLLSEDMVRSCCFPTVKLPVFCNLACCQNWYALVRFLECADNLKTLVFHTEKQWYHSGRYCHQSPPKSVPKCVSMSLTTFKYMGFDNRECEWKLFRCILKNAKSLNQMEIRTYSMKQYANRLKNLLKCPRASMTCEIGFFNHWGRVQVP